MIKERINLELLFSNSLISHGFRKETSKENRHCHFCAISIKRGEQCYKRGQRTSYENACCYCALSGRKLIEMFEKILEGYEKK